MLQTGAGVFGNWIVDSRIGAGSFGTVYKIKREEFGKTYFAAMKVIKIPQDTNEHNRLRSEGMDDASISSYYGQMVQNFINEIELLSSLDGITNIVDYKDHIIEENEDYGYTIYIKMQLLQPLSEKLIGESGCANFLSQEEVVKLGIDICSALEICEKNNIIHRDIKIDNIFISANGDYKLGDFGIAKQLESTQGELSQKGTFSYMAPEIFRGESYDKRSDIYALGLLLYRLLNKNRAPFFPSFPEPITFSAKESANVLRLRGEKIPVIDNVVAELNDIVLKACEFSVEKRYQSASELKKDLIDFSDKGFSDQKNENSENKSKTEPTADQQEKQDDPTIAMGLTFAEEEYDISGNNGEESEDLNAESDVNDVPDPSVNSAEDISEDDPTTAIGQLFAEEEYDISGNNGEESEDLNAESDVNDVPDPSVNSAEDISEDDPTTAIGQLFAEEEYDISDETGEKSEEQNSESEDNEIVVEKSESEEKEISAVTEDSNQADSKKRRKRSKTDHSSKKTKKKRIVAVVSVVAGIVFIVAACFAGNYVYKEYICKSPCDICGIQISHNESYSCVWNDSYRICSDCYVQNCTCLVCGNSLVYDEFNSNPEGDGFFCNDCYSSYSAENDVYEDNAYDDVFIEYSDDTYQYSNQAPTDIDYESEGYYTVYYEDSEGVILGYYPECGLTYEELIQYYPELESYGVENYGFFYMDVSEDDGIHAQFNALVDFNYFEAVENAKICVRFYGNRWKY